MYLLGVLWLWFVITTIFAFYPDDASTHLFKVSKILFGTILSMVLLQDPRKIRALVWVIALSIGFYGFKGGLWAILTGGGNRVLGPPDSFIEGNTEIGLALNMVIPLLIFLQRQESATLGASPLAGRGVPLHRRESGHVLSGCPARAGGGRTAHLPPEPLALRAPAPSGRGHLGASDYHAGAVERPHGDDRGVPGRPLRQSAPEFMVRRLGARQGSPGGGGGFRTFTKDVYEAYVPGYAYAGAEHDAHSIYFQVLGEHGFVGLGIFVALLVATLIGLRRVANKARHDPSHKWIGDLARMCEISVLGYVVSGTFLSMSYFDLFYHLVAITAILKTLVAEPVVVPVPAPSAASAPVPLCRRRVDTGRCSGPERCAASRGYCGPTGGPWTSNRSRR